MRYSMCRGCVRQVVVYRGVREESNQSFQSSNKQICIRSLKIVSNKSKDRQYIYWTKGAAHKTCSVTLSNRYPSCSAEELSTRAMAGWDSFSRPKGAFDNDRFLA